MTPVQIPIESLSPETVDALIDEFVTRHGADSALHEHTLGEKKVAVARQLERGELVIVFDSESETCNIMAKEAR
jgi:uncharacterized protein YheU (UPF0270 family)